MLVTQCEVPLRGLLFYCLLCMIRHIQVSYLVYRNFGVIVQISKVKLVKTRDGIKCADTGSRYQGVTTRRFQSNNASRTEMTKEENFQLRDLLYLELKSRAFEGLR